MRSFITRSCFLALGLLACSRTDDATGTAGAAETGWVGDTSYELGALLRASVTHPATGDWADLESNPDRQLALVDLQWKFAKSQLETQGGFLLNQLADKLTVTKVQRDGDDVQIDYEARVDLLHATTGGKLPSITDVKSREMNVTLPFAPDGAWDRAEGKCHQSHEGDNPSGEYNFYYYFAPNLDCPLQMINANVVVDQVYPREKVYPEYDKLMGQLDPTTKGFQAAIIPDEGDGDVHERYDLYKNMLARDLKVTGESVDDGKILRFQWRERGVGMTIDLFDPAKTDLTPTFRSALSSYSFIFFNGHSIYGTRELLTDASSFKAGYQLLMMHSCRSYPYYARQVFRAKATDADPTGWANADVIATGESSYPSDGPVTLSIALRDIMKGMHAVQDEKRNLAPDWLTISTEMNAVTEDIYYGVSGVRTNAWKP